MPTSHVVDEPAALLSFLFSNLAAVKKAQVRQWLKYGAVQVNGKSITHFNHPLKVGDVVSIHTKREAITKVQLPAGMNVLFEDASLLVVEKPEGLLSVASEPGEHKTAYAVLTDYVRSGNPRSAARVWIVHRLDRETSGIMVFAKTEAAKRALQSNWHRTDKRYLAVVEGRPPADQGVLSSHLDESGPFKVYSAPPSEQTRHAVTNYRVLKQNPTRTLIELTPTTGRRNQIRVHLADAACPIIGDQKYGARTNPAQRMGLHANYLQFTHPSSEELLRFELPLPEELSRLI